MNRPRFLTASLLGLAGLLTVAQFILGLDLRTELTVLWGTACLAASTLMLSDIRSGDNAGAILSLLGLWVAAGGIDRITLPLTAAFMVLDVLVAIGCFYLVFGERQSALRPRPQESG